MHILDAIDELEIYLDGGDYNSFINNSMMKFACIKQMEIIGEAGNHLSENMKSILSGISWPQIIG